MKLQSKDQLKINDLYDMITASFRLMLYDKKHNSKEVTGIKLTTGQISLYTNNKINNENLIEHIVHGNQDDIPANKLSQFADTLPRVALLGSKLEQNRRYVVISSVMETLADVDLDKENEFQGLKVEYRKNVIYIDESMEFLEDPRKIEMKHADYQVFTLQDYTVHMLIKEGYRSGFYQNNDQLVYGIDNKTGKNVSLGEFKNKAKDKNYERILSFESLAFPIKKIAASDDIHYILPSSIDQIKLSEDLKDILNRKSGIVVLDSFNAYDLINSDLIENREILNIWYSGSRLPSKSRYNIISTSEEKNNISDKYVSKLKYSNYNLILDDNNKLSINQIISLAEENLVIIGANLKDTEGYFRKFDQITEKQFKSYLNRCIYIGSMYTKAGIKLNNAVRELIYTKDYKKLGNLLENSDNITNIILKLFRTVDFKELYIKDGNLTIYKDKEVNGVTEETKFAVSGIEIKDVDIYKMIIENFSVEELDKNMEILEEEGSITFHIVNNYDNQDNVFKIIKINVIKNENSLILRARNLIENNGKDLNIEILEKEGIVATIVGGRETGKTTKLKGISRQFTINERVYIYDPDYDFSKNEFGASSGIIIDRDKINMNVIRTYDPGVIIINGDIELHEFKKLYLTISDRAKLYMATTYDISRYLLEMSENDPENHRLAGLIDRGYSITLNRNKDGSVTEKSYMLKEVLDR